MRYLFAEPFIVGSMLVAILADADEADRPREQHAPPDPPTGT
jgi:hypothetical protein